MTTLVTVLMEVMNQVRCFSYIMNDELKTFYFKAPVLVQIQIFIAGMKGTSVSQSQVLM